MSDLFMDMHRRRRRQRSHQNTPPPTPTSDATTTTTSDTPSSPQHINAHTFSHHCKNSSTAGQYAAHNVNYNYNFNNRKEDTDDKCNDDDAFENTLSLKLKKPKHWKWELSTSKSCSNIAIPRIILYNHKGELLVDAKGDTEGVYTQKNQDESKHEKSKKRSHQSGNQQRSATVNLTHSIRQALEKEFNGLQIQEATPSPQPNSPISLSYRSSRKPVDYNTNDLPDNHLSRHSSSSRGVRFIVEDDEDLPLYESVIPELIPTPPSTTTHTSSSSGPREKRKYRRSQSSGRSSVHSESILERFSYQKGRFSSPEFAEESEVQPAPRYFLSTCSAGTVVVKEDSFKQHPKRRRRPLKNRSTESLRSVSETPLSSSLPTQKLTTLASSNSSDISYTTQQQPKNRHLTDRNSLLGKQSSTSEEDVGISTDPKPLINNVKKRDLRKSPHARSQTKDLNFSTDAHQNGKVR